MVLEYSCWLIQSQILKLGLPSRTTCLCLVFRCVKGGWGVCHTKNLGQKRAGPVVHALAFWYRVVLAYAHTSTLYERTYSIYSTIQMIAVWITILTCSQQYMYSMLSDCSVSICTKVEKIGICPGTEIVLCLFSLFLHTVWLDKYTLTLKTTQQSNKLAKNPLLCTYF
jgi:hypothetical protein